MKARTLMALVAALCVWAAVGVLAATIGHARPPVASAAAPAANDVVVAVYDFAYEPADVSISLGTTVVWQNWGAESHTVSITSVADSGAIAPGDFFTHTFDTLGTYPYQCSQHPEMQGIVRVLDASDVPVNLGVGAWKDQTVAAGATIDYHALYRNFDWWFGTQNVVVTVTLPTASVLVTSTMDGIHYPPTTSSGGMLVYSVGALDAGAGGIIDLSVRLPVTLAVNDEVLLSVRVTGLNPDPVPDDNYAEIAEKVPGANMAVWKRPAEDSGLFVAGGVVTWTVYYANFSSYIEATAAVVTDRLPAGVTFLGALRDDWTTVTPISPTISGSLLTFSLGTLQPGESGRLWLRAGLDPGLFAKTELVNTAGASTTAPETAYDDNFAWDVETVLPTVPDLWVAVRSSTDGEIDGYQGYQLSLGNSGPLSASNVSLAVYIPSELTDLEFGTPPDALITRSVDYLATWNLGDMAPDTWIDTWLRGLIRSAGQITLTATITSPSPEADPTDNLARATDLNLLMLMPTIEAPSTAIVGSRPVFFGLGRPNASVTLYLSGTNALPGRVLGTETVDGSGRWVITPTTAISLPGWYWFTATQQAGDRASPATGAGNYVSDTLILDTNSMVRYLGSRPDLPEGERVGGINQPLTWARSRTYTLGARLTRCAPDSPISPTLQVLLFNDEGLMVGHRESAASYAEPTTGYVEFEFESPWEGTFELFVNYFCPAGAGSGVGVRTAAVRPNGWYQDLKDWFGCWESLGCDKPDPPPPPPNPQCPGCTPIPRPRPRPKPVDPDGLVYDCGMVRAGASMTQSIITEAWVTATQQTNLGVFTPWNALEFDQVNPQYTGPAASWFDKVPRLGYYSFLVPSGKYRIQVTAKGFLPFESPILQVLNAPVTFDVPMKRLGDVGECVVQTAVHRAFLPLIMR